MSLFSEAEQRYREFEERLVRGELTEDEFLLQVSQLRVVGDDGRRWMLSGRSGRWLVYDGRRWVFADPAHSPAAAPAPTAQALRAPVDYMDAAEQDVPVAHSAPLSLPRLLVSGLAALALVVCLVSAGAAAWTLFFRDLSGEASPPPSEAAVALVVTWTPRPATATYTPTSTRTPTRTPTPTVTPVRTDTPVPTATSAPTATPAPLSPTPIPSPTEPPSPSPTEPPTSPPSATAGPIQTYVVQKGDTLYEIASRFGVSLQALAAANGITNPTLIRPGQVLVIPQPGVTPPAVTRTATPTWTPIALGSRTPTPTKRTSTPTPTKAGSTPKPSSTPTPKSTATPKPPSLTGKIAFALWNPHLGSGKYELFVSQIDGTGRVLIATGFRQPQFSGDGTQIAVNGDRNESWEHLDVLAANGAVLRTISEYSEDAFPSWSPDGQQIAYSSEAYGDGRTLLGIVYDQLGRGWRWVPYGNGEVAGSYPFWMADGRIVYSGCSFWSGGGNCGLYLVGPDGGNPQRVTEHDSDTAPDGFQAKVTFMSSRDGNWEIYTVNADGSALKRLTNNSAEDGLPTWSPDGKSIAFVSTRGGSWAIWAMNSDGSNQRKLFDLGGGYGSGEHDWTRERLSWAP